MEGWFTADEVSRFLIYAIDGIWSGNKNETHFVRCRDRINRNKIYLLKGWITCLDSVPMTGEFLNVTCRGISIPPFALEEL